MGPYSIVRDAMSMIQPGMDYLGYIFYPDSVIFIKKFTPHESMSKYTHGSSEQDELYPTPLDPKHEELYPSPVDQGISVVVGTKPTVYIIGTYIILFASVVLFLFHILLLGFVLYAINIGISFSLLDGLVIFITFGAVVSTIVISARMIFKRGNKSMIHIVLLFQISSWIYSRIYPYSQYSRDYVRPFGISVVPLLIVTGLIYLLFRRSLPVQWYLESKSDYEKRTVTPSEFRKAFGDLLLDYDLEISPEELRAYLLDELRDDDELEEEQERYEDDQ